MNQAQWIAQFKVGQIWQCVDQEYGAHVIKVTDTRITAHIYKLMDRMRVTSDCTYAWFEHHPDLIFRVDFQGSRDAWEQDVVRLINLRYSP